MGYYTPSVDFDESIVLALCDARKIPIMEIHAIKGLNREVSAVGVDELHFEVSALRSDIEGKVVRNELFDTIKEDMVIKLNEEQFFVIKSCDVSKETGEAGVKSVEAYSYEYTLSYKKVKEFDLTSRMIYDPTNHQDANGYHRGFLNYVEEKTYWKVAHVSAKTILKVRELKFSNRSILDCIHDCMAIFNCVFFFDTVNNMIYVYDVSEVGGNQGIVISDENFISNISQSINTENLITRLYMYGSDDFSFHAYNPTGTAYMDNISFYRDFGYMSKELVDALDKYHAKINEVKPGFSEYLENLNTYDIALSDFLIELKAALTDKLNAETQIDNVITQHANVSDSASHIDMKIPQQNLKDAESRVNSVNAKIEAVKKNILAEMENLSTFREQIDPDLFFTEELKMEYDSFIKEDVQTDNSFVRGMEKDLMDYCQEIIEKASYPTITFDVDLETFRTISNFRNPMARLKLADMVYLNSDELNINVEVRILSMSMDYESHSVSIKFGNKYKIDSAENYLSELLNTVSSVTNSVNLNDFYWNRGIEKQSLIDDYLDKNLDLAKQAIVTAENQKPILDSRGLWLFKENPDGSIDNKQVRAINNVIAFTNDNWNTVSTAISGDGINAEAVTGRLGNFVTLNANQIEVSDTGLAADSDLNKLIMEQNELLKTDLTNSIDVMKGEVDEAVGGVKDVMANAVLQNKFYNRVKITPTGGIQVFDASNNERVKIGQISSGNYGIKILSADGYRTMLDDRGMLQTWDVGRTDNVAPGFPLVLNVWIPQEAREIYRVRLKYTSSGYRQFGQAVEISYDDRNTISGYGQGNTTSSGGLTVATASVNEFYEPGQDMRVWVPGGYNPDTGYVEDGYWKNLGQAKAGHNHGVPQGSDLAQPGGAWVASWTSSGDHVHNITIPSHQHSFIIPDHMHKMRGQITEGATSTCSAQVNGSYVRTNAYDDGSSYGIDITSKMNIGAWNTIILTPNGESRIDANVFIQCLMNL